jgi:AAA family ATP:ADP antiporter
LSETQPQPDSADPRSPFERFLGLFTEVRAGEGTTALLMFANVLLILCAYYLVKPLREGWLAVSGIDGLEPMELKAYSSFGQAILLVFVVASYGRLVERWPRGTLITRSTLFCMSNLVIFWFLQPNFFLESLPGSGIVFYLWVGIFGVFVVSQFWAFAADLYTDERGRRLMPLVAIGATSGAAVGSGLAEALVANELVPTEYLLIAALVPLTASILLTRAADARERGDAPERPPEAKEKVDPAISLVLSSRFLLAVGVVTLVLNWVNTNGENLLFQVIQESLHGEVAKLGIAEGPDTVSFVRDGTTAFYGNFFFWVNIVALVLQSFVASRLLKYGGFGAIFLLLPVVAFISYTMMALLPVLAVIKAMKIAENATDYSINNTARHVLWLPMEAAVTYKAKPTIDSLFVRAGDGFAALTVLIGVRLMDFSVNSFFLVNIALVVVWLLISFWIVRRHRELTEQADAATA